MNPSFLMTAALAAGNPFLPFPPEEALQLATFDANAFRNEVTCISVDGADPSAHLMAKIREAMPLAGPQSECTTPDRSVVHKPTGKHAAIISVSGYKWTSATAAVASYSINSGPQAGNWYTAKFLLSHGRWKLVAVEQYLAS